MSALPSSGKGVCVPRRVGRWWGRMGGAPLLQEARDGRIPCQVAMAEPKQQSRSILRAPLQPPARPSTPLLPVFLRFRSSPFGLIYSL